MSAEYRRILHSLASSLGLAAAVIGECAWTGRVDNTFQPKAG